MHQELYSHRAICICDNNIYNFWTNYLQSEEKNNVYKKNFLKKKCKTNGN
jgi:hypothetical protein